MTAELVMTSSGNAGMIQEQAEVWDAGEGQEDHAFFGLTPEQIDASC